MGRKGAVLYGWGVPLAICLGAFFGGVNGAARLALSWGLMHLATFGMSDAVRRGMAGLISRRKVFGAALLSVLMCAILSLAGVAGIGWITSIEDAHLWIGAAGALMASGCVMELFAARCDGLSVLLSDFLTCVATTSALLASGSLGVLVSALGVLVLMLLIAFLTGERELPQVDFRFLRQVPAAFLRSGLYPAAAVGLVLLRARYGAKMENLWEIASIGFGFLVISLSKSTFRRDESESAALNVGLTLLALICMLIDASSGYTLVEIAGMPTLVLSAGCGLILFSAMNWRTVVSAVLLILAAFAPPVWKHMPLAQCGAALAAALLMIPEWRGMLRGWRAKRLRRRLQKR